MSKPVRSLSRGLTLLAALNARCQASLAELAKDTGLPKPTAYRLLQTLLGERFIIRDEESGGYRLAAKVCSLSSGFEEDAWLVEHTRVHLDKIGKELVWPMSVTTLAGLRVMVRCNTDSTSPLAVRRLMPGMTLPILESASGKIFLAFSSDSDRRRLIDSLKRSPDPADFPARNDSNIEKLLAEVRELGFATQTVPRRVSELTTLGIPIFVRQRVIAAVVVRYSAKAVTASEVQESFLPALRETATDIGADIEQDPRASRAFGDV